MAGKGKNANNNNKSSDGRGSPNGNSGHSSDDDYVLSSPSIDGNYLKIENTPAAAAAFVRSFLDNIKSTDGFEQFGDTEFIRKLMSLEPYTDEEQEEIRNKGLEQKMMPQTSGMSNTCGTPVSNFNSQQGSFLTSHAKPNHTVSSQTGTSQHQTSRQPAQESNPNSSTGTTSHNTTSQQPQNQQGSITPMPSMGKYGFVTRPTPRPNTYESDRVLIPRNSRGITEKERNKSRELCTTAITPSIKRSNITKILTSDSASSYDISEDATQWQTTLLTIHRHVVASDFKHIIMIPQIFDEKLGTITDNGTDHFNAILDHDKLHPDQYTCWQKFLREWGGKEEVTSDQWLEEMLMKSLEPALHREVLSAISEIENENEQGSITTLRIIINRIVQSNQESRRAMEEYIKNFDIRLFPGEDVTEACLRIKAIAQSIGTHQLPSDIIHRVLEGFVYASTPAFQNFCYTQESVISSSLVRNRLTSTTLYQQLVDVLSDLETRYMDLRNGQRWLGYGHGTSTTASAFVSNTSSDYSDNGCDDTEDYTVYLNTVGRNKAVPYDVWVRDKTCHHCGEIGHVRPCCPNRDQPPAQRRDNRKYHNASKSNGTGGKRFEIPTSSSRENTSYKHSSSRQTSNEKKEYVKKVLTAVMDLVDSEDDVHSHVDNEEHRAEDTGASNTVLNAITSPTTSESKYAAFLAALGCPKE
jgi:hypothetical protein